MDRVVDALRPCQHDLVVRHLLLRDRPVSHERRCARRVSRESLASDLDCAFCRRERAGLAGDRRTLRPIREAPAVSPLLHGARHCPCDPHPVGACDGRRAALLCRQLRLSVGARLLRRDDQDRQHARESRLGLRTRKRSRLSRDGADRRHHPLRWAERRAGLRRGPDLVRDPCAADLHLHP